MVEERAHCTSTEHDEMVMPAPMEASGIDHAADHESHSSLTRHPSSRLFEYLLHLADNDLVLAQRLGEWVGKGPILEEDIASTNVGLDLLGQARLWLAYAGEV